MSFQDPRSYESYIDAFALRPGEFIRDVDEEGGYIIKDIFTLIQRPEPPGTIWTVAIRFTHCPKAFRISPSAFTMPEQWRPKI